MAGATSKGQARSDAYEHNTALIPDLHMLVQHGGMAKATWHSLCLSLRLGLGLGLCLGKAPTEKRGPAGKGSSPTRENPLELVLC